MVKKVVNKKLKIEEAKFEIKATNARFVSGQKVFALIYPVARYTKEQAENIIAYQQSRYSDKDIIFMPSLTLSRGPRPMKSFHVKTKNIAIDLYGEESNIIHQIVIYIWGAKPKVGGNDFNNDCLYNAILKCINIENFPKLWNNPAKFKKKLCLERYDKVSIEKITDIEIAFKININVSGDYYYTSGNLFTKTCNLSLIDGHYSIINNEYKVNKTFCYKAQKLIVYYEDIDNCVCYDGTKLYTLDFDDLTLLKEDYFGDKCHVECFKKTEKDLKDFYEYWMKNSKAIYERTKGLIDYSVCQYNDKNVVLKLFDHFNKSIPNIEAITGNEELWIKESFTGSLQIGIKTELKSATCYDINSCYPNQLISNSFRCAVRGGEFKKIESIPDIISTGIYRCIIHKSGDYSIDKCFRFNIDYNKYTQNDINLARILGLKIELIVDDEANALLYGPNTCINGSILFKDMTELLYKLKSEKFEFAKSLLSSLWGGMAEKRKFTKVIGDTEFIIPENTQISSITPSRKGAIKLQYYYIGGYFKTKYARLAPFLTSAVRLKLGKIIYKYKDNIYRSHTDSIITDIYIDELKISDKIGDWKIESIAGTLLKNRKCIIKNSNEIFWYDENDNLLIKD